MKTNFRRCLALGLAAALWHAYSISAPAAPVPVRLKPAGDVSAAGPVFVNGEPTQSGATFFSGGEVQTGEAARAVLGLGAEGRAELMPRSSLKLDFGDGHVAAALGSGGVRLSKPKGVSATVATADGSASAGPEESAVFLLKFEEGRTTVEAESGRVTFRSGEKAVEVGAGGRYTSGQEKPGTSHSLTGRQKAAIVFGVGGFIALLAVLLSGDDEVEPPEDVPCVPIVSPTDGNPQC
jgi:hypothetical protein